SVVDSSIVGNATGDGGNNYADVSDAGSGGQGGGIATGGPLTVIGSTIAGNRTGDGGCTVSRYFDGGNGGFGGGIASGPTAPVMIVNSTIAQNTTGNARGNVSTSEGICADPDNGYPDGGQGGGVYAAG